MELLFKNKPAFTEVDPCKVFYNIGSLMDIPTGRYVKGQRGENILNGGLSVLTAIVGRGNTYKSTIMHYMMLSASNSVASCGIMPYINTYDTEMNIDMDRLLEFSKRFDQFKDIDILQMGAWCVTDKTNHLGNEWYKILKEFLKTEKIKNRKEYLFDTPFIGKDGSVISTIFPSFTEVDSISEFETADIEEIQDKNQLGDAKGNTIHMRAGLAKTRLLMELPGLCNESSNYMLMSAHIGATIAVQQGPYTAPPPKKLQHMKMGDEIKGVPNKFYFLPNIVWQTMACSLLINQGTKGPEYPKTRGATNESAQDLNIVTLKTLRCKSGPTGHSIDLIVSQSEGVLPSLSEFNYVKENGRYGLDGNVLNYSMALYPEAKLSRTTVRETIDNDPMLRRAIKITADLLQIKMYHKGLPFEIPSPQELYAKLSKKYDWKKLLETRDYWTFKHYENPVPFLSTLDLVDMYYDKYTPYFLK